MKRINFLILGLLSISTISCAQDIPSSEVPSVILNKFQQDYTNATHVEWEKKMNNYEVEFEIGRTDHEIIYSAGGELIRHEEDLSANELPSAVSQTVKNDYAGYHVDDVDKITDESGTYYIVELEASGKSDLKVFINTDGTIRK